MLNFKGMRFPVDVILACLHPLIRGLPAELPAHQGDDDGAVGHSSINRWPIRFLPLIETLSRKRKRPVGGSWRIDETYIKVKGEPCFFLHSRGKRATGLINLVVKWFRSQVRASSKVQLVYAHIIDSAMGLDVCQRED